MTRVLHAAAVLCTLATFIPAAEAMAQQAGTPSPAPQAQQPQMFVPEPIADDDPRAVLARAFAEAALAGDRQKLEAFLDAHAAPSLKAREGYPAALDRLLEGLATGARTIVRMDGLGKDRVAAALGSTADGEPERAIMILLDPEAPHRIANFGLARVS